MGWKENGKYGVSTGRTVRSPFASSYGYYGSAQDSEVLLKFTRGTDNLSTGEMQEFLTQNDISDGLGDFTESTTRLVRSQWVDRYCSVPYSLKKRKRWRLAENVRWLDDSMDTAPNVTFIHRRVGSRLEADCIAVERAKECEVLQPRKRKYTRAHDLLKRSDKTELEPEVCYEMTYRYPVNEYPECKEVHGRIMRWSFQWSVANPRKARCKNKGVKNKGHRWGEYSDAELRSGQIAKEKSVLQKKSRNTTDSKVQVIGAWQFSKCNAYEERSHFSKGFDIGCCMKEKKKQTKKKSPRQGSAHIVENQLLDQGFRFGKNSVIYIDRASHLNSSQDTSSAITKTFHAPNPHVFQPEKKVVITMALDLDDVKPANLKSQWNDLYSEANSFPRRFTIEITPLLSDKGNMNIDSCYVLFEVMKNATSGVVCTTTDVSLHITRIENSDSSICKAVAKVYSELDSSNQEIWKVGDVVDCAVQCLSDFIQPLQLPMKSSGNRKEKTWSSVEVLGKMCGWKSEVFTHMEMKSKLWAKIKKAQTAQCKNDFDISNETDNLEMSCGICCEELSNQRLALFTVLNRCRHVFCNECWEAHLKTQISHGNTELQCPGYKCDVCLDDGTIMALVPSWYNKYMSRKVDTVLEASSELQWCPSKSCGRVIRATASAMTMEPASVACACGGLWCFHCSRAAHWPASCAADKKFHEVTKQYLTDMELNREELITSVMVRNCPNCRYPIEKYHGCNFMYCIMCQTAFCWECLTPITNHKQGCQRQEHSKEIELDATDSGTNHFARYFSMYCDNKRARFSITLSRQRKRLRLVNRSVALYKSICSSHLYFDHIMEQILHSGCHEILRNAAEFKYCAHLTLEGAAKVAILSKSTSKGLHKDMERLQFIVEKIESLTQAGIAQILKHRDLSKLTDFLHCGENCVAKIGQFLARRQNTCKL